MSSIKKLAGQTFWYGFSNIFGRFLNYLLTPLLTSIYGSEQYGDISILFAAAAFLNIVFTYGMETSYFRFSTLHPEKEVYNTASTSIMITTLMLVVVLMAPVSSLASFMKLDKHPEFVKWVLWIVALDTLAVLPFSKLRYEGRPRKFAAIKIVNILINVGLVIFFLVWCKGQYEKKAGNMWSVLYNPDIDLGYVFLANLIASAVTLLLLGKELLSFRFSFNKPLLKEILLYSAPLIIVGFGGMVNETIDRFMIVHLHNGSVGAAKSANGIYSANYKLAVLIVLFIQAFRMGAEPFFFKQSGDENAPKTYARVMKFFVITCCVCFLAVVLFLDFWKYFMGIRKHPEYLQGLVVVPVLMLAKICLGAYYNLSIWYKLTNKNLTGAYITIGGAVITVLFNYIFIPRWGYVACAFATLLCYGFMMVASYRLGQKHYPIPYAWKKLSAYVVICILLFLLHQLFRKFSPSVWWTHLFGFLLLTAFVIFILKIEKKEFQKLPFIGKFIR
ncbi:MAG: oligosaccharide flippase family protein [Chitinophagaceae bacterium]|nr:oligosaccharide flippase family protein [Chitinophagaceae bacterium]